MQSRLSSGTGSDLLKDNGWIFFWLFIGIVFNSISSYVTLFSFTLLIAREIFRNRFSINTRGAFFLLVCTLSLFCWSGVSSGLVTNHNAMWLFFLSTLSYMVGAVLAKRFDNPPHLYYAIFILFLILALPNIPITLYDIYSNGLVNPERQLSVLGDGEQHSTTGRTVELCMAIAGICMVFITSKNQFQLRTRRLYIILALIAELCTLHYVSRTGISVFLIAFILGFLIKGRNDSKILYILLFGLLVYYFFEATTLGDLFRSREIEGSSVADAGGRTDRWLIGFLMMINNPHGYTYGIDYWYAHNFWLDFGREGGLYAFIALSFFSVIILWKSYIIAKNKTIPDYLSKSLFLFSICIFITLFTEAVHNGAQMLMYVYFIFSGIIMEYEKRNRIKTIH